MPVFLPVPPELRGDYIDSVRKSFEAFPTKATFTMRCGGSMLDAERKRTISWNSLFARPGVAPACFGSSKELDYSGALND